MKKVKKGTKKIPLQTGPQMEVPTYGSPVLRRGGTVKKKG